MMINSLARRLGAVALALVGTLLSSHTVAQAGDGVRAVALSARPAPGTPAGALYAAFDLPILNDLGQAAFAASIAGAGVDNTNGGGIWSEGSGGLAMVARGGGPAPGTAGRNFRGVGGRLGLSNAGRHAFEAALADVTQYDEQGIWSDSSGSLALVARQRDPAVGTPNGVYFSHLNPGQSLVSNQAGQAAFTADLHSDGLPWGSGLWAGGAGNLRAVALSGGQSPGTPGGAVFATFGGYEGVTLNDAGRTAFLAALEPGTNGVTYRVNDTGVWSEGSGTLALVARAGSQAPGTPGGVTFGPTFFPPAFNNAGSTAFAADLVGTGVNDANDTGLWSTTPTGLQLVARSGGQARGTPAGVNFGTFHGGFPSLSDAGHIAILTYLTGNGISATNDRGIWLGDPASLELVARNGSQAPGTAAGVVFGGLTEPALNNAGQIAFVASLMGSGVGDTNDVGIWATDATGALRLIVRTGDVLDVGTGDLRTIGELDMVLRHGGSDGRPSAFNDLGQIAFRAGFTDGSAGIFVSDVVAVPEPGGLALPGLALLTLLRRRTRARTGPRAERSPTPARRLRPASAARPALLRLASAGQAGVAAQRRVIGPGVGGAHRQGQRRQPDHRPARPPFPAPTYRSAAASIAGASCSQIASRTGCGTSHPFAIARRTSSTSPGLVRSIEMPGRGEPGAGAEPVAEPGAGSGAAPGAAPGAGPRVGPGTAPPVRRSPPSPPGKPAAWGRPGGVSAGWIMPRSLPDSEARPP